MECVDRLSEPHENLVKYVADLGLTLFKEDVLIFVVVAIALPVVLTRTTVWLEGLVVGVLLLGDFYFS